MLSFTQNGSLLNPANIHAARLFADVGDTAKVSPLEAVRELLSYSETQISEKRPNGSPRGPVAATISHALCTLLLPAIKEDPETGLALALETVKKGMVVEGLTSIGMYFAQDGTAEQLAATRDRLEDMVEEIPNVNDRKIMNCVIPTLTREKKPAPRP